MKERLREQWKKCEDAVMNRTGEFLKEHSKLKKIIEEAKQMGYTPAQINEMCAGEDSEVCMKAICIDDKGNFKLCPYRVFQKEKKAMMIGNGDMVVQCFYPCAGAQCIAYHDGICLRAQEVLERMV